MTVYSGQDPEPAPEGMDIDAAGHGGFGSMLGAEAVNTLTEGIARIPRMSALAAAEDIPPGIGDFESPMPMFGERGEAYARMFTDQPETPIAEAQAQVKAAKLDTVLRLPDKPAIKTAALDILIDRARARQDRDARIAEGPSGFVSGALDVGTSFLVGAADPLNLTIGMIPVMGEARYAKLLQGVGGNAFGRAAARAGYGAAQGALFSTAMTPLDWLSQTQEGRDYGMSDVLHSLIYGAGQFAAMHAIGGAGADIYRSLRGRQLYPYGPGEPLERTSSVPTLQSPAAPALPRDIGQATPGAAPAAAPRPGGEVAREVPPAPAAPTAAAAEPLDDEAKIRALFGGDVDPVTGLTAASLAHPGGPADVMMATLPPRAIEDLTRTSIADWTEDRPVNAGQVINAAAALDPQIADAVDVGLSAQRTHAINVARFAIYDDFKTMALAAGAGDEEATHAAAIATERYLTRAERNGEAPANAMELYKAEALEIRRGGTDAAPGRAFEQRRPGAPLEGQLGLPGT
jgi:hypothetical protein